MKTKAKKFSHKLLALFMAVLMAASCFTGALTAYADTMSSEKTYADESIEHNDLDRKSTRLNSSHRSLSRMPSSA